MKKLFSTLVSLVIILAIGFAAYEAYLKKPSAAALAEPIVIGNGMSTPEIAAVLKKAGVISSTAVFTVVADMSGSFKNFHAGTFLFKQGMSAVDALKTLSVRGPAEITITIPEGFDLRDIAARLVDAHVIKSAEAFYAVAGEPAKFTKVDEAIVKDYPFLSYKPVNVSLEGYLFPDTYRFYAETDPAVVVRRMLDAYADKLKDAAPDHDTLTTASLLQKEVKDPADQAKVADIIKRRLAAGMALQLDSTVNYVTGKNSPSASAADLSVDSPWNTYLHKGLPPGPIDNPGAGAVNAVRTPTPNKYWYFLTTPDGQVIYSTTLEQHNAAKAEYLK